MRNTRRVIPSPPAKTGPAIGMPGMNLASAKAAGPHREKSRSAWLRYFAGEGDRRKTR